MKVFYLHESVGFTFVSIIVYKKKKKKKHHTKISKILNKKFTIQSNCKTNEEKSHRT